MLGNQGYFKVSLDEWVSQVSYGRPLLQGLCSKHPQLFCSFCWLLLLPLIIKQENEMLLSSTKLAISPSFCLWSEILRNSEVVPLVCRGYFQMYSNFHTHLFSNLEWSWHTHMKNQSYNWSIFIAHLCSVFCWWFEGLNKTDFKYGNINCMTVKSHLASG